MRTGNSAWSSRAGVGAVVVLAGLAGCSPHESPADPGSPLTETKRARSSLPDSSADIGIWLLRPKPEKLYNPRNSDCSLDPKMWPEGGSVTLGGTPTTMTWKIYNSCGDEQYVRIDFLGPTNPFASCDKQEVMDHKQFKVPVTRNDEPSVIATCTLIPKPCDWFFVEVNKFSDRTKSANCPYTSGQIEIDPW